MPLTPPTLLSWHVLYVISQTQCGNELLESNAFFHYFINLQDIMDMEKPRLLKKDPLFRRKLAYKNVNMAFLILIESLKVTLAL